MSIRDATAYDLPRLLELGEAMHKESPRFSRLRFSEDKAVEFMAWLIADEKGFLKVAERDGEIIGGMAAMTMSEWFSHDTTAYELAVFMAPEHRGGMAAARLLKAYRDWAKSRGAVFAAVGLSTGVHPEATARLYERVGLVRVGPIMEFTLEN